MVDYVGSKLFSLDTAITADTSLRQSFYNSIPLNTSGEADLITIKPVPGTATNNLPFEANTQTVTGFKLPGYGDVFYNRILIDPSPLRVGNVTTDSTFSLFVFNAFFENRTVQSILENGVEGISLVGITPPRVLAPLEELEITVNVLVNEGPPVIDGEYVFQFSDGVSDRVVQVLGARVLPFPYIMKPGALESLTFITNVIESNNGYEQRIKVRNAPRQEFLSSFAIPSSQVRNVDSLLYGWRSNAYALPLFNESKLLDNPTSTSSAVIDVNTSFASFEVGGLAMIFESEDTFELIEIQGLTGSQITATANISRVYTNALVTPVKSCRMISSPTRRTNGYESEVDCNFGVIENTTLDTSPSPLQYKGLDVFVDEQLVLDQYSPETYTSRVDVIDFGSSQAETFAPWEKTKIRREFGLFFENQEKAWNHRLWIHRRAGRQRPFWSPTYEVNFRLISTGTLDIQLLVEDDGQSNLSSQRDDIAIKTTSGWLFRGIASLVQNPTNIELTVDSSLGIDASEVEFISFLGRKRLASDRQEIVWQSNYTSEAVVSTLEINN